MYSTISHLLGYRTQPTTTTVPVSEHPLTRLIKDKANLSKTPEPLLWNLNKLLHRIGVADNHPVRQEIDKRLSHQALPVFGLSHPQPIKAHTPLVLSERTYVQPPTASIEDTQKALEALEGKLDAIELCLVNDDLMAFIAQKFPQLKTFKLVGSQAGWMWHDFTDKGLESIAQLKGLESLTIDAWMQLIQISYEGFTKLISQPEFAAQLKELKIRTFFFVDEAMPALAKYKQLQSLYIGAAWIKEPALMTLLQSSTLKKSVTDFTFFNSQDVALSDNTLSKLKDFASLEHLALCEGALVTDWKVSDPVLIAFLEAQKKLKTLDLRGPVIKDPIAEKIGQMAQLEVLRLGDCSEVTRENGWKLLLGGKIKLAHLDIANAQQLDENNMPYVSQLPLSFLSIDNGGMWVSSKWMEALCTSPAMQKNLKTLRLTGLTELKTGAYEYLQTLENLTSLKLNQSHWFNRDALDFLSKTSLAKTLKTLELVETGFDDNCIPLLPKFKVLQNLLLGSCYALTKQGRWLLLNGPYGRQLLKVFGVDGFDSTVDDWTALANFYNLTFAIISNSLQLSQDFSELYKIAKEHRFELLISWGFTGFIESFESVVAEQSQ